MEIRARIANLTLHEPFEIARGVTTHEPVLIVELEHDGVVGAGEGAPVDYHGETTEAMLAETQHDLDALLGDDPFAIEAIMQRLRSEGLMGGTRMAIDGALHDWVGKRLGQPTWRVLGLSPTSPATSFTIGIDTVEGTADKVRRAVGYQVLKVKVGGASDLERLEAVRAGFSGPIRIDGNEGWDIEIAKAITPDLVRLGVEFVEQPFPRGDHAAYRQYRALAQRLPVVLDEGCIEAHDVPLAATLADGVNIKLSKTGGIRGAIALARTARAHNLSVMLGCMIESHLGISQGAQIASLMDHIDLDGHLLIDDGPFEGLGLSNGVVTVSSAPGLGVRAV
ncbi:MAG: dipeptide epimerase [Thermoleophilia bacterium]|nr:dipeptide epimerase [Thermoleophilia bacterium]